MSLFEPPTRCDFTQGELEVLLRPIEGDGGHQRFLRELTGRLQGQTLSLEDAELVKVHRYAYNYGGGGYQQAFRTIMAAARRAGWRHP